MFFQSIKNLFLVVLLHFFLSSCGDSHGKNIANKKSLKVNYTPLFSRPSKKYLKEKIEKIQFFYDNYLGGNQFNGMFLVAKNFWSRSNSNFGHMYLVICIWSCELVSVQLLKFIFWCSLH